MGGLGFAISGFHALLVLKRPRGIVVLVLGMLLVGCVKPYLLIAFGIGTAAWMYSVRARDARGRMRVRPMWLLAAVSLALVGVLVVGRVFPSFAIDTLGEQAATMQYYGRRAAGGSFYQLGDPTKRSLLGQVQFVPIALFTALYRPLIIEASNPQIFLNALETSGILIVSIIVFARRGWRWIVTSILSNPALSFAVAFALPLALGVGLISNNLGTLSRYRSPAVPFVVLTLAALYQAHAALVASAPARAPTRQEQNRARQIADLAAHPRGTRRAQPRDRRQESGEVPTK